MKKTIILIILSIFLVLPLNVKADMSAPASLGYEAIITNADGANLYEYSAGELKKVNHVDYNAKVKVVEWESEFEDQGYTEIHLASDTNGSTYYIKMSDFEPLEKEYMPSDFDKLSSTITGTILKSNKVYLYSGPAYGFSKKIGTAIPVGTKLTLMYQYGGESSHDSFSPWYYTEYNGIKGWISSYGGAIGFTSFDYDSAVVPYKSINLYKEYGSDKVITTIPNMETIKIKYSLDPWSHGYIVAYGNYEGYISDYNLSYSKAGTTEINISTNIYKYVVDELPDGNIVGEIPAGVIVNSTLEIEDYWYFVNYNGIEGWIHNEYNSELDKYNFSPSLEDEQLDESSSKTDEDVIPIKPNNKVLSTKELIIYSIIGAVILGSTAFVTIVLINKNKLKNKNTDNNLQTPENNQNK